MGPPVPDDHLYKVVEALEKVSKEVGKSVPQVAINWLLQRPTVATVILGARNGAQLRDNLGCVGWNLQPQQMAGLDAASATMHPFIRIGISGTSWSAIRFPTEN